jgi:hypothetical protein
MRGYFPLQEILCHNHMSYLCMLESPVFIQIVSNIQYGLKWVNPPHDISVSSECASALYHIVEYRFRGSKKEQQPLAALQAHIETSPQMFGQLLAQLLETVVYDDCPNQWALSRPMLGLILTNEVLYASARARIHICLLLRTRVYAAVAFFLQHTQAASFGILTAAWLRMLTPLRNDTLPATAGGVRADQAPND